MSAQDMPASAATAVNTQIRDHPPLVPDPGATIDEIAPRAIAASSRS